MKASLGVRDKMVLTLMIREGKIDFGGDYVNVNQYHYENHFVGPAVEFLKEVIAVMNAGNHDNSDSQTDYFDVGFHIDINVGRPWVT